MLDAQQAKNLAQMFIQAIETESQTTRKVLACMPEGQLDYKLGEKGRTARELMWHIVASEDWFAKGIAAGEFGTGGEGDAPATVADILAVYDRRMPAAFEGLKALSGEQLLKTINFFNVFDLPAVLYMDFWKSHTIHHRGQLSTYLRSMNAHVPDIYGGSADEPFQMPAGAQP